MPINTTQAPDRSATWSDLPHRWYFAVTASTGERTGQLYVVATNPSDAINLAQRRISPDELLGEPVRFLPAALV